MTALYHHRSRSFGQRGIVYEFMYIHTSSCTPHHFREAKSIPQRHFLGALSHLLRCAVLNLGHPPTLKLINSAHIHMAMIPQQLQANLMIHANKILQMRRKCSSRSMSAQSKLTVTGSGHPCARHKSFLPGDEKDQPGCTLFSSKTSPDDHHRTRTCPSTP